MKRMLLIVVASCFLGCTNSSEICSLPLVPLGDKSLASVSYYYGNSMIPPFLTSEERKEIDEILGRFGSDGTEVTVHQIFKLRESTNTIVYRCYGIGLDIYVTKGNGHDSWKPSEYKLAPAL